MLSLKTFSLLLGVCAYHFVTSSALSVGALQEVTECGRVINDESQARECLNVTDLTINPPSPVILEATVEDDFICKDKPVLYSFSCTLYGYNLIWYLDNDIVTSFLPNDTAGEKFRVYQYPRSAPLYNITAVLTQVSEATVSRYNAPFCVSVLTVQPFNESEVQVLPFTVSCQTHCEDENKTAICQTRHYDIAAKPSQPSVTSGNIQTILDNDQPESSESGNGIGAIASLNWNPPENHNETAIDFYELKLIGTPNNSTFYYRATTQQTFLSKYVLPEGNYTAVRITAVDLCEQRSEPSQVTLSNINKPLSIGAVTVAFATTADSAVNAKVDDLMNTIENKQSTIGILAGILAFTLAVIIIAIIIVAALIIVAKRGSCGSAEINNN